MQLVISAVKALAGFTILLPYLTMAAHAAEIDAKQREPVPTSPFVASATSHGAALGAPIGKDRLDAYRGGHEVSNLIVPNGYVQGNSAVNVVTGSNAISDGSFSSASGFPIAIQNTGANVLIQNSMIVNVHIQ